MSGRTFEQTVEESFKVLFNGQALLQDAVAGMKNTLEQIEEVFTLQRLRLEGFRERLKKLEEG